MKKTQKKLASQTWGIVSPKDIKNDRGGVTRIYVAEMTFNGKKYQVADENRANAMKRLLEDVSKQLKQ